MLTIQPRPLPCWHARSSAVGSWRRSPDNSFWHPSTDCYPDTSLLLPGDIILFQPLKPHLLQKAIQEFQGGSPFTHAAVYLSNDHLICEADPVKKKVVFSNLEDRLDGNCVLFRRVEGLEEDGRHEIARMASSLVGNPYGFSKIVEAVLCRITGLQLPDTLITSLKQPLVCSTLCEHAILAATKGRASLRSRIGAITTPADLATTSILKDIDVAWRSVIHSAVLSADQLMPHV